MFFRASHALVGFHRPVPAKNINTERNIFQAPGWTVGAMALIGRSKAFLAGYTR
jgi:hypothetical protein